MYGASSTCVSVFKPTANIMRETQNKEYIEKATIYASEFYYVLYINLFKDINFDIVCCFSSFEKKESKTPKYKRYILKIYTWTARACEHNILN